MVATAPGPRGLPWLGSLIPFAHDPLAFVTRTSRVYGDVARYRIGGRLVFLVTHPEGVQQVLVNSRDLHKDSITASLGRLLGRGLLTAEDDLWKRQRKLAAPSFQPRHLARYGDAMVDSARSQVATWSDGARDVHEDFTAMTLDIVLRTLFGSSTGAGREVGEALGAFMGAFEEEVRSWRRLLPASVPTAGRRTIRAARATIERALDRVIAERRADGLGDDLLSRLLAARDDDGNPMSDEQLRDEAVTLFLAGHETTALALSYAAWLLAGDADQQAAVRAEIDEVLGDRPATLADLPRLRRTEAAIKEALRLYPPAWMMGRCTLSDIEVMGYPIPKGSEVLLPPWVVHRDARFWLEPEAFRPERWLDGEPAHRFAWYPFGGGPRVCIGNHFAMMEAVLALATTLQHVALTRAPGAELDLQPAVTLRPRSGVHVVATIRATRAARAPDPSTDRAASAAGRGM